MGSNLLNLMPASSRLWAVPRGGVGSMTFRQGRFDQLVSEEKGSCEALVADIQMASTEWSLSSDKF